MPGSRTRHLLVLGAVLSAASGVAVGAATLGENTASPQQAPPEASPERPGGYERVNVGAQAITLPSEAVEKVDTRALRRFGRLGAYVGLVGPDASGELRCIIVVSSVNADYTSVGCAFEEEIAREPRYITYRAGGNGFVAALLAREAMAVRINGAASSARDAVILPFDGDAVRIETEGPGGSARVVVEEPPPPPGLDVP